jgi:hypothetical protein
MSTSPVCRGAPPADVMAAEVDMTSNGAAEAASTGMEAPLTRPEATGAAVRTRKATWNSRLRAHVFDHLPRM